MSQAFSCVISAESKQEIEKRFRKMAAVTRRMNDDALVLAIVMNTPCQVKAHVGMSRGHSDTGNFSI